MIWDWGLAGQQVRPAALSLRCYASAQSSSVVAACCISELLHKQVQLVGGKLLHQLPLDEQAVGAGQPRLSCLLNAATVGMWEDQGGLEQGALHAARTAERSQREQN